MILKESVVTFCTLGIIHHMIIAERMGRHLKWGDILSAVIIISLIFYYRIVLHQIFHTRFDWNLVKGCSLHEENSMDKHKDATIFRRMCNILFSLKIVIIIYCSQLSNYTLHTYIPIQISGKNFGTSVYVWKANLNNVKCYRKEFLQMWNDYTLVFTAI